MKICWRCVMNRYPFEDEILTTLCPSPDEAARVEAVAEKVLTIIDASGVARGMVVGSIARNTWTSGDHDLDIFMLFDPSVSREALEEEGRALGTAIARQFGGPVVEKYAEHPYTNTIIEGFDIDLVPCYAVESAARIQSAVDRTPFHTHYIISRIIGHEDEVRLFKQLLKVSGLYGSDTMTEGFAGYLCELLILFFGGFHQVIAAAADWKPGVFIDCEKHATKSFDDPLIVIDPVDPRRNVAASLSLDRFAEFVELCRGYAAFPSRAFFEPQESLQISEEEFDSVLTARGTTVLALRFATPKAIPDIIVPQLRRTEEGITTMLARYEFSVHRSVSFMGDEVCMILVELLTGTLPALRRHAGPPVWNKENAEKFVAKYRNADIFGGPAIEDGRYFTEIERQYQSAAELLRSDEVLQARLGKHVARQLKKSWDVLEGPDVWDERFSSELAAFFSCRSPYLRLPLSPSSDPS